MASTELCSIHSYIHDALAFIVWLHWNSPASLKKRGVNSPFLQSKMWHLNRLNLPSFLLCSWGPAKRISSTAVFSAVESHVQQQWQSCRPLEHHKEPWFDKPHHTSRTLGSYTNSSPIQVLDLSRRTFVNFSIKKFQFAACNECAAHQQLLWWLTL